MQEATPELAAVNAGPLKFEYKGDNGTFFGIYFKNIILTMVTMGIYSFWAKVENTQYIYQHLFFNGRQFNYHATGKELFIGFLKGMGIVIGVAIVFSLLSFGLISLLGATVGMVVLYVIILPAYFFVVPFIMYGKMKFWLARTSWSNVRFRFDGEYKPLLKMFAKMVLFSILTLGLYLPFWITNFQKYMTDHASIGQARFQYHGTGKDLFWMYLKGFLLTMVTLGIYYPWFLATVTRYMMGNTTLASKPIRCNVSGGQFFKLILGNLFLVLCTFGLAFPVAINRQMRVFFGSLELDSDESILQGIMAQPDYEASAFAGGLEQAADALDAVTGLL